MDENLTLEIKYFGRIHYAKLELNKINVIGRINSSGKSTSCKLLYCFLKANSLKRLDHVKEEAIPLMNNIINIVANPQLMGIRDYLMHTLWGIETITCMVLWHFWQLIIFDKMEMMIIFPY